jgi:hypothetical protein
VRRRGSASAGEPAREARLQPIVSACSALAQADGETRRHQAGDGQRREQDRQHQQSGRTDAQCHPERQVASARRVVVDEVAQRGDEVQAEADSRGGPGDREGRWVTVQAAGPAAVRQEGGHQRSRERPAHPRERGAVQPPVVHPADRQRREQGDAGNAAVLDRQRHREQHQHHHPVARSAPRQGAVRDRLAGDLRAVVVALVAEVVGQSQRELDDEHRSRGGEVLALGPAVDGGEHAQHRGEDHRLLRVRAADQVAHLARAGGRKRFAHGRKLAARAPGALPRPPRRHAVSGMRRHIAARVVKPCLPS